MEQLDLKKQPRNLFDGTLTCNGENGAFLVPAQYKN